MKSLNLTWLVGLSALLTTQPVWSFCSENITDTVTVDNFVTDTDNGVVSDSETGLMWSICNYGESWDSDAQECTETPLLLGWQESLQTVNQAELAGYTDWRLPNIKELMSIIERSCAQPAVQVSLFPSTQDELYWSSTPVYSDVLSDSGALVWAVHFKEGSNTTHKKTSHALTRMVRKIQ